MDRCLAGGDIRVNIDCSVIDETVSLTVTPAEEHRLALHHILLHQGGDRDAVELTRSIQFAKLDILCPGTPMPAVLVHIVDKHLVIE